MYLPYVHLLDPVVAGHLWVIRYSLFTMPQLIQFQAIYKAIYIRCPV
jgi:hypothetical protein